MLKTRKKLIEVALPLESINRASIRENYIYRGNPSSLHKWWAQRPLAAARAVIFAQLVDDPSEYVDTLRQDSKLRRKAEAGLKAKLATWNEVRKLAGKAKGSGLRVAEPGPEPRIEDILVDNERQRLFHIIEQLVLWENTSNETVLKAASDEIWASWRRACADNVDDPRSSRIFNGKQLPAFLDPFAGGGTLPLEAQRLGLTAHASDLNPVAVLINKAMIEIPPRFAGRPPVRPQGEGDQALVESEWAGSAAIAEDVQYYGRWMRNEAERRIGNLYPKATITASLASGRPDLLPYVGQSLDVIAWIWARTVKSPNPAFRMVDVPLASTFMLSTKPGAEAYVLPVTDASSYRFDVRVGRPKYAEAAKRGTKLARASFACLMSDSPVVAEYIRAEGVAGRMGARLMAIVAEGERKRIYLAPTADHEAAALRAEPTWRPDVEFFQHALGFRVGNYGMRKWGDLFTARQLVALATMSDLVQEVKAQVARDALAAGLDDSATPLSAGGAGAVAYADAISLYLAFAVDKYAVYGNSLVPWYSKEGRTSMLFGQQVVSMVWDYTEVNPFSNVGGSIGKSVEIVAGALDGLPRHAVPGTAAQRDASAALEGGPFVVSTDPPYYDNVGYADLSDFFYVWLRHSQRSAFPSLFSTVTVPKGEELVATPDRHGGAVGAEAFFLRGMTEAMRRIGSHAHPTFPVTIYYAFKQTENKAAAGTASTGWETFLDAVIRAGFAIHGTWPMRTERTGRIREASSNALASSVVLVCRPRPAKSPTATRREFIAGLNAELPSALANLQRSNIAPVDLAQAAIGPGMAIFTRYSSVLDADGRPLSVREALTLINQTLDQSLVEQEGDFDADTRWALAWFEEEGFGEGAYGVAEQLSKSKNTSVDGMVDAGILVSKRGKVRLLKPSELAADWDPASDDRLTTWEIVHHLVRLLEAAGESGAATLLPKLGVRAEAARELAYRLFNLCERKRRATEALAYNGLVQSWPEIARLAAEGGRPKVEQAALFAEAEE